MNSVWVRIIAIVLAGNVSLTALGAGTVLCIGESGHVALETSLSGKCCGPEDSHDCDAHEEAESCVALDDTCCYGCIDIPVPGLLPAEAGSLKKRSSASHETIAVTALCVSPYSLRPDDSSTSIHLCGRHNIPRPDPPVVLRT